MIIHFLLVRIFFCASMYVCFFFFFQAEDGIRDLTVTGVQTCALPILALRMTRRDAGRARPASRLVIRRAISRRSPICIAIWRSRSGRVVRSGHPIGRRCSCRRWKMARTASGSSMRPSSRVRRMARGWSFLPDHLASGVLVLRSAPFESTHNSRTQGDSVTDSRSSIAALSDQLADAVAAAGASVVAVHARPRLPSTGVHWKDGVVVTTDGTVKQEEDIAVPLPDGKRIPATFAGRDRGTDLAVLRIPSASLPVAKLGDPAVLRPGNLVLALGRLDEGGARAAFGAVSATGGKWRAWKGGEIDRWLQSALTIYPGVGGGPLVDSG